MRKLALVLVAFSGPALAEPAGTAVPAPAPSWFEMLTSKIPLSELPPVPFAPEAERLDAEIDAAICASYRRWKAQGNRSRDHMESWCPTERR